MYPKILAAAVKLAAKVGVYKITRSAVADAAKVAPGSVSYHFDGMDGLINAVVEEALRTYNWPILATCLQHPKIQAAANWIKERAARSAAGLT